MKVVNDKFDKPLTPRGSTDQFGHRDTNAIQGSRLYG